MSGQTFSAGVPPTAAQLTAIQYQNEDGVSNSAVTSGSDTTTSASYVSMTGTGAVTSFTFTKVVATTRLKVEIAAGWSPGTSSAGIFVGVQVSGTDYDCGKNVLGTGVTGYAQGFAIISGLAAGSYTIQARWKRYTGTGTATRDTNAWLAMSCAEIT